jgi:hypothetical protein
MSKCKEMETESALGIKATRSEQRGRDEVSKDMRSKDR